MHIYCTLHNKSTLDNYRIFKSMARSSRCYRREVFLQNINAQFIFSIVKNKCIFYFCNGECINIAHHKYNTMLEWFYSFCFKTIPNSRKLKMLSNFLDKDKNINSSKCGLINGIMYMLVSDSRKTTHALLVSSDIQHTNMREYLRLHSFAKDVWIIAHYRKRAKQAW